MIKLRIFGFFFFGAKNECRTTNQPEVSCSSWKTPTEALKLLQEVFGDDTMSRTRLFEWHRKLKEGREEVEDDHRGGRPSTNRTDKNVERVRQKVWSDRCLTGRMITDKLGMNSVPTKPIFFSESAICWSKGKFFFGNIVNKALENSTNLWKYDIWYTLILDWYKIWAHKRLFRALGTIVLR